MNIEGTWEQVMTNTLSPYKYISKRRRVRHMQVHHSLRPWFLCFPKAVLVFRESEFRPWFHTCCSSFRLHCSRMNFHSESYSCHALFVTFPMPFLNANPELGSKSTRSTLYRWYSASGLDTVYLSFSFSSVKY
jgi:hypothetical protein